MPESDRPAHSEGERSRGRTGGGLRQRARRSWFARRVEGPVIRRLRLDETAGWPVIIAGVVAMAWANSPWSASYEAVWSAELTIAVAGWSAALPMRDLVDVVLLPLFFLLVAVEIRQELHTGYLAEKGQAILPLMAAVGGMIVPAGTYLLLTRGTPYTAGFGVPVATDIAFALAFLQILGPRVPAALKAFLLAFAAVDDVGGIVLIAAAYGHGIAWSWLGAAAACTALLAVLAHRKAQVSWHYAVVGVLLWGAMLGSGVHVTIAGVIFGLLLPTAALFSHHDVVAHVDRLDARLDREDLARDVILGELEEMTALTESVSERFARKLRPWVSYLVLPIFGLAMAGTALGGGALAAAVRHPVTVAIVMALLVGKPLGVLAATWLTTKATGTALPADTGWLDIVGIAVLAGIGFTVSLFIAKLAFAPAALAPARVAVFGASIVAAVLGVAILAAAARRRR